MAKDVGTASVGTPSTMAGCEMIELGCYGTFFEWNGSFTYECDREDMMHLQSQTRDTRI